MADNYIRGDTARLSIVVTDDTGAPTDPQSLTLTIRAPSGAETTDALPDAVIVHDGTGAYHRVLVLDETGVYVYQWETTGPAQVQGGHLHVHPAPLDDTLGSLDLESLKRRLDRELTADDDKLRDYLEAAFAQAQASPPFGCGRLLVPGASGETRTITVPRPHHHFEQGYPFAQFPVHPIARALIPDASEITTVTSSAGAITDYQVVRHAGYIVQLTGLPNDITSIDVTGRFGFTALPAHLADAIYVLAARMAYEEAAQYSDQVQILEDTAVMQYYRQLPVRTKLVFKTFTVPAAASGLA